MQFNKYNSERFDYVNDDFKIISELNESNEAEVENGILDFIQNIVNDYKKGKKEYLKFLSSETVDVQELLSVLNKVRLIQKIHTCCGEIIESHNIEPNSEEYTLLTNDELYRHLDDLNKRVNSALINIQREYNELFDIDDGEEYSRVQKRRKKFRQYSDLLRSLYDAVNSFVNITAQSEHKSKTSHSPSQHLTKYDDVKTINFDTPYIYIKSKPLSFSFYNRKYTVANWTDLYAKFLGLLYNDNNYVDILKNLIGKSLYGHRIDFANKTLAHRLRRGVRITSDFFAEGNLNAPDLIKHVKRLLELCSIDSSQMIIEYITRNNFTDISEEPNEEDNSNDEPTGLETGIESKAEMPTETMAETKALNDNISNGITLKINGKVITAYDYSDALKNVCEFSINYKPFKMARIAGLAFKLRQKDVFYRTAVPVEDCNKLSNGLQVLNATSLSDLKSIVEMIKGYCEMPDDMITIV